MEILPASPKLPTPAGLGPTAIGLGIFDGVHIGHRALLQRVIDTAAQDHIRSIAYTFDPHPVAVLRPEKNIPLIEPLAMRLDRFAKLGFSAALVEHFDHAFSAHDAEQFVKEVLVDKLQARHVVVGDGFTFGKGQQGNVALLQALGARYGFVTHPIAHVMINDHKVSSTAIRQCVQQGDMQQAARMLGRYFAIKGQVIHGAHRGAMLGFPTANVMPTNVLQPAHGVYAAWVHAPTHPELQHGCKPAVVNIGFAPTFGEHQYKIEAHLLDFTDQSLYDHTLYVHLVAHLRKEMRFSDRDTLITQITYDVGLARERLQHAPSPNADTP